MSCLTRYVRPAIFVPDVDRSQMKEFIKSNGIRYPTIVSGKAGGELVEVMNNSDLAACKGDAQTVLARLHEKGVVQQRKEVMASL
jgi:hypothetical protein